ncbi:MAG: hypothetical protein HYX48_03240 [Chlamydiales bacterium]|nr:hypothetical protein [Chlamydiales bacterium]
MTSLKPVSSIIADFCGDNNGWDAEGLSRAVIGGVLINTNRPLLEIEGNPLPIHLQQLVVSFLFFKKDKDNEMLRIWCKFDVAPPFIEDYCLRTGLAFSRHMQGITGCCIDDSDSLTLSGNFIELGGFRKRFPVVAASAVEASISHEFALSRWQDQEKLHLNNLPDHTDGDISKLLAPCGQIRKLSIKNSPRLFSLGFLPGFHHLTSLTLVLPQLRNKQPAHLVPLEEVDLTPVDKTVPSFDLSKFQLPELTDLTVSCGPHLFQVDARHFPKLDWVTVTLNRINDGDECPTGRKFLFLNKDQQCTVDWVPSNITISGKPVSDWLTVIREEPKKEESKNDSAALIPAGMSLS